MYSLAAMCRNRGLGFGDLGTRRVVVTPNRCANRCCFCGFRGSYVQVEVRRFGRFGFRDL